MNPTQLVQNRSSLLIFRDCLKLSSRMVTEESKIAAVRRLVRKQFEKNKEVFDQDKILSLKMNAVKGISNYIIHVVHSEYKLNKKKEVNIMDEQENLKVDQEDLQEMHVTQHSSSSVFTQNSKMDEVK